MRDYSETTVRTLLGLPADDHRITLRIDTDGREFRDTWCDVQPDEPAAVHVTYWRATGTTPDPEWDEITPTYSWNVAAAQIAAILTDPTVNPDAEIPIVVNSWYLLYALKDAA
ncbi:hypothetical protein ACFXHA_43620 [Nocardia sp. NPDC059240]|uniref:hypothetical protein n=1 Tax=Nocardia sp. NPDC059240 TaxID=3346786 RepID=UPI0036C13EAA